jgi:hypothetical protein
VIALVQALSAILELIQFGGKHDDLMAKYGK